MLHEMTAPNDAAEAPERRQEALGPPEGAGRELFRTRAGFVLAAAGSAIGLGNMWRFPYQTAEGGGAAFVVLYLAMTALLGKPIQGIISRARKLLCA